jgi:hypothetical protein
MAVRAKNLDGVNLDFEGQGPGDQAGLTHLVTAVSGALHTADPNYQVTMDTYASSAGDPDGFYNIAALAPAVNAFFVMEYQLNLDATSSATSPLTSTMFSDVTTLREYLAAVPAAKVILGLPLFGIDWPTTNGTLGATATGPASDVADSQITASGHPVYWDTTTDTAWTSYQVGTQWHETFFENPMSLYDALWLSRAKGLAGVGLWALGMEGNDPSMVAALSGAAPADVTLPDGPATTSTSPSAGASARAQSATKPTSTTTTDPKRSTTPSSTTTTTTPTTGTTTTTTTTPTTGTTTTTTVPTSGYTYSALWNGQEVTLSLVPSNDPITPSGSSVGDVTDFATDDPANSCLDTAPSLSVWAEPGMPAAYLVQAAGPAPCTTAEFTFTAS